MNIHEKLSLIQNELHVPKNRMNKFGGYKYRSCEDIVDAVKPLLKSQKLSLVMSDNIRQMGLTQSDSDVNERVFLEARAILSDGENKIECLGLAEIAPEKKGMDVAQITGAASSYARKYALNGLFAIDDVQDADFTNTHGKDETLQDDDLIL